MQDPEEGGCRGEVPPHPEDEKIPTNAPPLHADTSSLPLVVSDLQVG